MGEIDIHTHAFPDGLAARAISRLESLAQWKAVGDGTVKGLVRAMDKADVDVSVMCAIATKPTQAEDILQWCAKIASDRIVPFPSIHPTTPELGRWLGRIADEGFVGIKLHPLYQEFCADAPQMDELYDAAMRLGLVVAIHCGHDIAYPPEDDRASPRRMRNVIDRHAGLKLVCTHMGGWRQWEDAQRCLLGTSVYLETSFSLADLGPQRAADMIRRHGPGRVMMGSDWPWADQRDQIDIIRNMGLETSEAHAILCTNAAKLLGI